MTALMKIANTTPRPARRSPRRLGRASRSTISGTPSRPSRSVPDFQPSQAVAIVGNADAASRAARGWPGAMQRGVLVSLPGSELSDDLFPQRGRKRLLARDQAGLPDRLAHLVEVGATAGAIGEVSLEPLPLVGRQRIVEVVGDDLDHLLAAELVVHGDSVVK